MKQKKDDLNDKLLDLSGAKSLEALIKTPIQITIKGVVGGDSDVVVMPTCLHSGTIFFDCPVDFMRPNDPFIFKLNSIEFERDRGWSACIVSGEKAESRQPVTVKFLG